LATRHKRRASSTSPKLERVDLGLTKVASIAPLARLPLRVLDLTNGQVRDLSPLGGVTTLEELELGDSRVDDLKPLARLSRLKKLGMARGSVGDLSPLASLTTLEELIIPMGIVARLASASTAATRSQPFMSGMIRSIKTSDGGAWRMRCNAVFASSRDGRDS
jgi:hypothetical protein